MIARVRMLVIAWFVRLSWAPLIAWGLFNLYEVLTWSGLRLGPVYERKQADAAIRIGTGVVLFLVWLFMIRTRGRFTLNRDGRLER
jgi:hypothetical protein